MFGVSQSMDVKKCNRVNAFQTSWSAPLMVLTPGPVFQVQSGKEENYIKCRKLRGCISRGITEGNHPKKSKQTMTFEKSQGPQTLDQRLVPPKVHYKDVSMDHREFGWSKDQYNEKFV